MVGRLSDVTNSIHRSVRDMQMVFHISRLLIYHGKGNYIWDNLGESAITEDTRDIQGQGWDASDSDHLDLADTVAKTENAPASLDVPRTYQEVDDDRKQMYSRKRTDGKGNASA